MISNKTFMLKPSMLSVAIAASFVSVSAFSATASTDSSTDTEDTVVVTAAGYDQLIKNASASVSVLTREELSNRYYTDVTDAISSIPGVIVAGGGNTTAFYLRGMGSDYTLILVDGQPINSSLTHPNSDGKRVETTWLPPLQAIERIEVIKGPMSTLYGSDALGGVINIITRKNQKDWTGNIQLNTVLQEDHNSGDEQNADFFLTGPLSDSLTLQLYGKTAHRDEDSIESGTAERDNRSIGSKLSYQVNDDHEIIVSAETSRQTSNATEGMSSTSDSTSKFLRTNASVEHKGHWDDLGNSDTYLQYDVTDNPMRTIKVQNVNFKSTLVMPFTSHTLNVGVQGKHEKLNDETTNTGGTLTKLDNTSFAIFSEDEWRIIDNVALTGGVRYDHDEKYGSHFSPRIYSVWNIDTEWTLKGGVSTGFKAPTVKQSSADWVKASRGGDQYGNPDLDPETSVTEEISLEYSAQSGLKASLGLFNNDFKDMISTELCTASSCDTLTNSYGSTNKRVINIDKAVTRGVEASLNLPVTDTIDITNSYTYTYSEQKSGDNAGKPLNQLPKHMFTSNLNWQATDDLQSWTKLTLRGKTSDSTGSYYSGSSSALPSYTIIDTGISYQLTDDVKLSTAVYNLFDRTIDDDTYGYIEDGRRYWVSMNVDF